MTKAINWARGRGVTILTTATAAGDVEKHGLFLELGFDDLSLETLQKIHPSLKDGKLEMSDYVSCPQLPLTYMFHGTI